MRARLLAVALLAAALPASQAWGWSLDDAVGAVRQGTSAVQKGMEVVDSAKKVSTAVDKASQEITPEQEYYIGRAVGANLLGRYRPWNNQAAELYLNKVGKLVSRSSSMPETYGGYHFAVLDSNEVNAFACPGGLILVTRGLLGCCASEDELAAVLAHEVGHVQNRDGIGAIGQSRIIEAVRVAGGETTRHISGQASAALQQAFRGSVGDVLEQLTESGYSRAQEEAADLAAVAMLRRTGYDPRALDRVLAAMKRREGSSGGAGFYKTHPDPQDRRQAIASALAGCRAMRVPQVRLDRFTAAMGR